jgi:hypothetical protein
MKKVGLLILSLLSGVACAGTLNVTNYTSNTSVFCNPLMVTRMDTIAKELKDPADFEGYFPAPPGYNKYLNAYSKPYGTILGIDARPKSSITAISVHLAYSGGTIAQMNNTLKFQVTDIAGFEHRLIRAQQVSPTVGIVHTIPKDGSTYTVNLPDLVNQPTGIYAVWVVTVDRILQGDIVEDGKVDFLDFAKLASEWMLASLESDDKGNYLVSDLYLNRLTDMEDLAAIINGWMAVE